MLEGVTAFSVFCVFMVGTGFLSKCSSMLEGVAAFSVFCVLMVDTGFLSNCSLMLEDVTAFSVLCVFMVDTGLLSKCSSILEDVPPFSIMSVFLLDAARLPSECSPMLEGGRPFSIFVLDAGSLMLEVVPFCSLESISSAECVADDEITLFFLLLRALREDAPSCGVLLGRFLTFRNSYSRASNALVVNGRFLLLCLLQLISDCCCSTPGSVLTRLLSSIPPGSRFLVS
ncbi:hypothetical protein LINPERHAP1_LOCUS37079 [Linum perenne]